MPHRRHRPYRDHRVCYLISLNGSKRINTRLFETPTIISRGKSYSVESFFSNLCFQICFSESEVQNLKFTSMIQVESLENTSLNFRVNLFISLFKLCKHGTQIVEEGTWCRKRQWFQFRTSKQPAKQTS